MITLARAEDWLPTVADGSVSLILTDPPYRNVVAEAWDRQWPTPEDYLRWLGGIADHWRRTLAANGSLYCFASPSMAARVEVLLSERFRVLSRIIWAKHLFDYPPVDPRAHWKATDREALRSWKPQTEHIIFAEQYGADQMAAGESGWAAQCAEARAFVFEPEVGGAVAVEKLLHLGVVFGRRQHPLRSPKVVTCCHSARRRREPERPIDLHL